MRVHSQVHVHQRLARQSGRRFLLLLTSLSDLEQVELVGEWPEDVTRETLDIIAKHNHHSNGPNVLAKLKVAIVRNVLGDEDDAIKQVVALTQLPLLRGISASRVGGLLGSDPLWSLGPRISNVQVLNMGDCIFEKGYFSLFFAGFRNVHKLSYHTQFDLKDEN